MIIGVDAGALSITDERLKVGVYRVTYNLLKELRIIDTENTYRLYSFNPIEKDVLGPRMENVVLTPSLGWSQIRLPLELLINLPDIFLGLSQWLPSTSKKSVGFIYDLSFFYNPQAYSQSYDKLKNQTDNLVRKANKIVTISEASKQDILTRYHIPPARVVVCYPGVDSQFAPNGKKFASTHPYFLFVGSLNKAKDLSLALQSFSLFLKKVKKPYDFILIGGDYWPDPRIDETIHHYNLQERVKKLGFISDEKLPLYYRGATAFFTTPLREGFCLPAAESMACGIPVVTVNRGAMKEVVGDGGMISDSLEPKDIADTLISATNPRLLLKLKSNAIKRARQFTWRQFASQITSLYAL